MHKEQLQEIIKAKIEKEVERLSREKENSEAEAAEDLAFRMKENKFKID